MSAKHWPEIDEVLAAVYPQEPAIVQVPIALGAPGFLCFNRSNVTLTEKHIEFLRNRLCIYHYQDEAGYFPVCEADFCRHARDLLAVIRPLVSRETLPKPEPK